MGRWRRVTQTGGAEGNKDAGVRTREGSGHALAGVRRSGVATSRPRPFTPQGVVAGGCIGGVGVGVSVPTPPVAAAPKLTISLSSP